MKIEIRKGVLEDHPAVISIATVLKGWFSDKEVKYIKQDLKSHQLLVAEIDSKVIGFLSYFTYEGIGHIGWLGVLKEYHRQGIGRALYNEFEQEMGKIKIRTLQVYTLGDGVDYEPYERTRNFYRKVGFKTHRIEETDNPECPEDLILRKII